MKNRPTREQLNLADAIRAVTDVGNYELAIEFVTQAETTEKNICLQCGTAFGYTRVPFKFTRSDNTVFEGFMHYGCARYAIRCASRQLHINWRRRPYPGRLFLSR